MTSAGSSDTGSFNRLRYDNCAYQKTLFESTGPLKYMLFEGKFENCGKCVYDNNSFYRPFDLVDEESELKNITRAGTKCPQFQYSPTCVKSKTCTSTFDKKVPIVLAQEVCPVVHNNIVRMKTPGYVIPRQAFCGKVPSKDNEDRISDHSEGLQKEDYSTVNFLSSAMSYPNRV